jgi:hypothetical protein
MARGPAGSGPTGYVFEVPANAEAQVEARPLPAMGRFVHEAVAVDPGTGIVYLTEDMTVDPARGRLGAGFYRFVPRVPGQLSDGGRLQALGVEGQPRYQTYHGQHVGAALPTVWVDVPDPDPWHTPAHSLCGPPSPALNCVAFSRPAPACSSSKATATPRTRQWRVSARRSTTSARRRPISTLSRQSPSCSGATHTSALSGAASVAAAVPFRSARPPVGAGLTHVSPVAPRPAGDSGPCRAGLPRARARVRPPWECPCWAEGGAGKGGRTQLWTA